jgi:hypothetical protein
MDISGIALQGLEGAQGRFERAASRLSAAASSEPAAGDVMDLSQTAVNLLSAKNDFEGNLKIMAVADEMDRATIDMLG